MYMLFFYKHSVFQSEARICLSFSQIEPQNMLKICLPTSEGSELVKGIKMKKILKSVPFRLLKSLT